MIVTFFILSVIVFAIIQLPPGDFLTSYIETLASQGDVVSMEEAQALRVYYGLDKSFLSQYTHWIFRFLKGDMGQSFEYRKPVSDLIKDRLPFSILLAVGSLLIMYPVAIFLGTLAAKNQYKPIDYILSVLGLFGLSTPNFMLALVLMYFLYHFFGVGIGGLYSPEFVMEPMSLAKTWDLLKHLFVPIFVIGTAGTASVMRIMRGTLLDELEKQYVITARAKGLTENQTLFRHPVRVAINPIVSTIGWQLPRAISGETVTAIVLALPTLGPLLLNALLSQDMYLAGSIIMILVMMTLIGTLVSDLLLAAVDPRIRLAGKVR